MTFDDPVVTFDGLPTEAFFGQLLAKLDATPAGTVAALQATTIPVDAVRVSDPQALTVPKFIALK